MIPPILSGVVHLSISWAVGVLVCTITNLTASPRVGDLSEELSGCSWTQEYTSQTNWL